MPRPSASTEIPNQLLLRRARLRHLCFSSSPFAPSQSASLGLLLEHWVCLFDSECICDFIIARSDSAELFDVATISRCLFVDFTRRGPNHRVERTGLSRFTSTLV